MFEISEVKKKFKNFDNVLEFLLLKALFAEYLPADGCFVKTLLLLTVMLQMMQSKLKVNLCTAMTETGFCKLSRPCKNFCCFQKMVPLFNLMQIMLLT